MATGLVFAAAVIVLTLYQLAGRRHHRRKDAAKAELLAGLEGLRVSVIRKRKRAYYRYEGTLDAARLDRGTLLLHAADCDHVLDIHDVKFVEDGERQWGPW